MEVPWRTTASSARRAGSGPTPPATSTRCSRRRRPSSPPRAWTRPRRRSPTSPGSASAPSTGTSRSARTWSRRCSSAGWTRARTRPRRWRRRTTRAPRWRCGCTATPSSSRPSAGSPAALHSGDPAFDALPGYFAGHSSPPSGRCSTAAAASGEIRADISPAGTAARRRHAVHARPGRRRRLQPAHGGAAHRRAALRRGGGSAGRVTAEQRTVRAKDFDCAWPGIASGGDAVLLPWTSTWGPGQGRSPTTGARSSSTRGCRRSARRRSCTRPCRRARRSSSSAAAPAGSCARWPRSATRSPGSTTPPRCSTGAPTCRESARRSRRCGWAAAFDVVLLASTLINADPGTRREFLAAVRRHLRDDGIAVFQQNPPAWFESLAGAARVRDDPGGIRRIIRVARWEPPRLRHRDRVPGRRQRLDARLDQLPDRRRGAGRRSRLGRARGWATG